MKFISHGLLLSCCLFMLACATNEKQQQMAKAHMELGNSYYNQGHYPDALKEMLKARKLSPRDAVILNALGITYHARGRPDLGIGALKEALEIQPQFTEARNNLVRVYIDTKNFSSAKKELDLVKKDLTYGALDKVHFNEGLLYFDQQKYAQALDPFAKAIDFNRSNCSAHHFYGRSLFEVKKYAQAAAALDRAVTFCQKSGNDEPHYYSALAHYRAGDKRKAAIRFEEILQLYPNGQYYERSKSLLEMVRKEL